jgi:hypothetical protein
LVLKMRAVSLLAVLLLLVAPSWHLQFQRGAVEQRPKEAEQNIQAEPAKFERLKSDEGEHFGTRRLPLRESVEHQLTQQEK